MNIAEKRKLAIDVIEDHGNTIVGIERLQDFNKNQIVDIMIDFHNQLDKAELEKAIPELQTAIKKVNKKIDDGEFIKSLSHTNDRIFVLAKAAEECGELNVVLLQSITKPDQYNPMGILSEMVDVKIQLIALEELLLKECHLGTENQVSDIIKDEMSKKIQKLRKYKSTIKNFGKIQLD